MAPIRRLQSEGRAGSGVPSAVAGAGGASNALANLAGSLSDRLYKLAEDATVRAYTEKGIAGGSAAGDQYTDGVTGYGLQNRAINGDPIAAKAFLQGVSNKDKGHTEGLDDNFAVKVASLLQSAPEDIRAGLGMYSGYRSEEHQARLWQNALVKYGSAAAARKWVAPPGKSQHNHGKAMDLAYNGQSLSKAPENVVKWLHDNAPAHGLKFPLSNENWHIEDDSTRGGIGTLAAQAQTRIDPRPLQLRRDGTIAGEAYDRAAQSAYLWRVQAGVSTDLFNAQQQFENDPAGFAAAVEDIKSQYMQDPAFADPLMREAFEQNITQRSNAYQQQITAAYGRQLKAEEQAAFTDGIAAVQVNVERQAYGYGANGDGDEAVGQMVLGAQASIDSAVANGTVTLAEGEKLKEDIAITASRARIQGVYDALPTPQAKEEFAAGLVDKWIADDPSIGEYGDRLMGEITALSETLRRDASDMTNAERTAFKAKAADIEGLIADDVASLTATGKGLDPTDTGLTPSEVERYLGPEAANDWKDARKQALALYDATRNMEAEDAADIATRLEELKSDADASAGKPGYTEKQAIYAAAVKRADDVLKERQTDPLGQAGRAGVVEITPIDPSTPEALSASLATRQRQRKQVSGLYSRTVPFFLPGEQARLSESLMQNPEAIAGFSATLIDTLGDKAVPVLTELSDQAPVIAHATALSLETGDATIADEVSRALALKKEKVFTVKMPSQADQTAIALPNLGTAFAGQPRLQSAALQTAAILFEKAANEQGFDPSEIEEDGTVAQETYLSILDRVTGGRKIQGRDFGGLADVNDTRIVVPPDMEKTRPQELLDNLSAKQLAALPPYESGDFEIQINRIRNAQLVGIGDGIYRVALGDAASDDPQYMVQPDGSAWLLDIRQLADIEARTQTIYQDTRRGSRPVETIIAPAGEAEADTGARGQSRYTPQPPGQTSPNQNLRRGGGADWRER
ncbi:M15 family metallopeptidase [Martelella mediterranea]|uniref:D-alanyl-D-alanine carboxypeptidase-like protein n=1 Tax=Martelella mediterranea TaxID=293089 RepID=A0A4R3NIV0_9HYPH|nr:M15 family metallopeptidase [Martelella mediterranea]TCT34651.1 D-alanyl-D-alanine carboxypeptidase-like protein [Martelella mediterranea]